MNQVPRKMHFILCSIISRHCSIYIAQGLNLVIYQGTPMNKRILLVMFVHYIYDLQHRHCMEAERAAVAVGLCRNKTFKLDAVSKRFSQ